MDAGKLTTENYARGFLIDDELLGGVAADDDEPGAFLAYVLRHATGEYLGAHRYPALEPALAAINRVPRAWLYEKAGGCGGGKCGEGGSCGGGRCARGACGTTSCGS